VVSEAYLKGNLGDYRSAELLYKEDGREMDALVILDRILGITGDTERDTAHMLAIIGTHGVAGRANGWPWEISKTPVGLYDISVDMLKAPIPNGVLVDLLFLRCMCFSALSDTSLAHRDDPIFCQRAIQNCQIVAGLLRDGKMPQSALSDCSEARFLILIGQVLGNILSVTQQLETFELAVSLAPNDPHIIKNVVKFNEFIGEEFERQLGIARDNFPPEAKAFLRRCEQMVEKLNIPHENTIVDETPNLIQKSDSLRAKSDGGLLARIKGFFGRS
jgi:hypothetical protein